MYTKNWTIVDVETTGGSPLTHRIIEIGILRVEKGEVVEKFKSLVNPGTEIPEFISQFTGITNRQVKKAPSFQDIAEEIFPLFEDAIFVAHNSNFDYRFVQSEFRRAGWVINMPSLCTVRLSRALYPSFKKHNLNALIERYNFKCKNRHRAFDDAKVLWDFFQLISGEFNKEHLNLVMERTMKKTAPAKQRHKPQWPEPEIVYEELPQ